MCTVVKILSGMSLSLSCTRTEFINFLQADWMEFQDRISDFSSFKIALLLLQDLIESIIPLLCCCKLNINFQLSAEIWPTYGMTNHNKCREARQKILK